METNIINGKLLAKEIRKDIAVEVENFQKKTGIQPCLAVIIVGENSASQVYVRHKQKACEKCGIKSVKYELSDSITEEELLEKLDDLNNDKNTHGILVQLPLPKHISENKIIERINPKKDVDGFHLINVGKLSTGDLGSAMIPCTPKGCLKLIKSVLGDNLSGKKAVVVGRSNIVGKPVGQLLLRENCTLKVTHSRTENLKDECLWGDIVVVAVGRPNFITKDMIKEGAVVIDVGINRLETGLVGDIDFENVKDVAGFVTPVPGGVGPMTVACLMENVLEACKNQVESL